MIALLLALACGGDLVGGGDGAEGDADDGPAYVLDDPSYRFCHEAGFQRAQGEPFCDLLEDLPPDRCPGLRESCENPELEDESAGCDGTLGMPGSNLPARPDEPRKPPEACSLPDSKLGSLRALLKWVAAAGVAAVVLVLLRLLVAYFGRTPPAPARGVPVEAPPPEDEALPDVPNLPSDDLLARAQAALEAGRFGEAVLLARGAALRRLAESGTIKLHRSRTDREYVHQARRSEGGRGDALQVVVRAVEAHRFGGRPLGFERASAALDATRRLLGIALLLLIVALPNPAPAHAQGWSRHGPFGDAALEDLLVAYGYDVDWLGAPLTELDAETDALVLDLTGITPSDEDWAAVRLWVEAGGVLVVAGDASPAFPELGVVAGLVEPATTSVATELAPYLPAPVYPDGVGLVWSGGSGTAWVVADDAVAYAPSPEELEGGGDTDADGADGEEPPVLPPAEPVEDPDPEPLPPGQPLPVVVALDLGQGVVLALADGVLLTNGALVHPDNERFLGELLHVGQGPLGWDLPTPVRVRLATWSSAAQASPPAQAANPRLLPFVLQLMLTWTLVGLWKGWPFGPLRDPPGEGRKRFGEHVGALATRYMRLGATGHAHAVMARLWLSRLGPAGLELAARRAGYDDAAARRLVRETEAAAASSGEGKDAADLEKVEELWRVTRGK